MTPRHPDRAERAAASVSLYEKQKKIYPRSVHGWFARWRWLMVWLTQVVFYGLPWLPWNGRQSVLFDLAARRFYIFDLVLYPQDFIYLTGLLVLSAYGLFFFTAVGGRLWCGYACPQTVYTEIFLWVEHRIEGERGARMKLDAGAVDLRQGSGARRPSTRSGSRSALWTGFTFVGYFTPIQTLWAEAFTLSFGPWEWFWVNFYGLATYGNAGFLREQVCKYMCPYARFQSAMFDRDTLIVSYDAARGDPRGTRARSADLAAAELGHCIDCGLCVHVCPVGIDIRDGLQYECIACTACIDACDGVMDKMKYPRGLIRYATRERRSTQRPDARADVRAACCGRGCWSTASCWWRSRWPFWSACRCASTLKVDVVRDRTSLARLVDEGRIENLYRLQLMNATEQPRRYRIAVQGHRGRRACRSRPPSSSQPAQARWVTLAVRVPPRLGARRGAGRAPDPFRDRRHVDDPAVTLTEKSTFVVPR